MERTDFIKMLGLIGLSAFLASMIYVLYSVMYFSSCKGEVYPVLVVGGMLSFLLRNKNG